MKHIGFKANPRYAYKFIRTEGPFGSEHVLPTRHFRDNFSTEQLLGRGIKKKEVFIMPAGIHVIHAQLEKPKLIKKEIQRAFGKTLTSTKSVVNKDTIMKVAVQRIMKVRPRKS